MVQLSICIPTYNRSACLARTLQKCVSEVDGGNLHSIVEILVGDNASLDETESVCTTLANKYQYFHYIKNKENVGGERNWLNLVNLAKGRYVWILSDDDDFLPGLVSDIIQIIEKKEYATVFLNYNFFKGFDESNTFGLACNDSADYTGKSWQDFFLKTQFASSFISSNIFNRELFLENLLAMDLYKGNPWLQLYVVKNITSDKVYYFYSALKLKMRVLPIKESRLEKYLGGVHHFYFNAHIAFIEFLVHLNWNDTKFRKKMKTVQFHQIIDERNTWRDITGNEDYKYWFLMTKKIISLGYFNKSFSFWCRDVFMMLLPFGFIAMINTFYASKYKFGDWLRACEGSQSICRRIIFSFYYKYKHK